MIGLFVVNEDWLVILVQLTSLFFLGGVFDKCPLELAEVLRCLAIRVQPIHRRVPSHARFFDQSPRPEVIDVVIERAAPDSSLFADLRGVQVSVCFTREYSEDSDTCGRAEDVHERGPISIR